MGYLSICTSACCLIIIGCFTAQTHCSADGFKYIAGTHSIVQVSAPSAQVAKNVAGSLLHGHLAACINMVSSVTSLRKQGDKVVETQEVLLFIKTRTVRVDELIKKLKIYLTDRCEAAVVPIDSGNNLYLSWISERVPIRGPDPAI